VNGFYFFVKRSEVIELDMSIDEALKYIISMGVVTSDNGVRSRKDLEALVAQQRVPASQPSTASE
jgi:uncharacterized membrane protein